jgi:hypothetical protein
MFRTIAARLPLAQPQLHLTLSRGIVSPPRVHVAKFDEEVVAKFPRVMDVINKKIRVEDLEHTEKVCNFSGFY